MKSLLMILFAAASLLVSETKEIKKTIPVQTGKTVELHGFTGSEIEIRSWDKNEVSIAITIDYSSSDKEKQEEYLQRVDVVHEETGEVLKISYKGSKMDGGGFSWKNFFKFNFSFYTNLDVSGVIYVPASCPLISDMRYGSYSLDGVKGKLELTGTGNTLKLKNCGSVQRIENNYGTTSIEHSGGSLNLEGMSSKISIKDFNGAIDATADYSTITINSIKNEVKVKCISGRIDAGDIDGNLSLDANYSTINAINIKGKVTVESRSGKILVQQAGGVSIDAPYSTITIETVNGAGEQIVVKSLSGKVEISNAMRDIRVDDSYSKIYLTGIQGNVNVHGNSSGLEGKRITGNLTVKTEYADVDVEELTASIIEVVNKSSGISLQLLTKPAKVEITNEYGPVDISFPEYSGEIRLKASYGTIKTNLPVDVEEIGGGAIATGKAGSGSGTLNIKTVSGNIEVRQMK